MLRGWERFVKRKFRRSEESERKGKRVRGREGHALIYLLSYSNLQPAAT